MASGRNYKDISGAWKAVEVDVSATAYTPPVACRGLYIGTAGDVVVDLPESTEITFTNVPVGIFPVQATKVYAAGDGTTALGLVALF